MLGTFTLVITVSFGGFTLPEKRTPGLSEIECKLLAAKVQKPKRAACKLEKFQDRLPEPSNN